VAWIEQTMLARLTFRDDDGAEATCQANLPVAAGASAGLSFLTSWRAIVAVLSSATCIEAELILRWSQTSAPDVGPSTDVHRHGVLIFNTAVPDLAVVRVPSLDQDLLEMTGPFAGVHIDQAQTAVIDLVTALTDGMSGVEPCDPFVNDLVTLSTAFVEQL
jgi:hypothetical protein